MSFSHGQYVLIAESPEEVARSDCFDFALTWPPSDYRLDDDVASFLQEFLRSSPNACCIAEVGDAKVELAVWDWGPKPRYIIDLRPTDPEYYYYLLTQDAEDRAAVEEIARYARKQFMVIACTESRLLATHAAVDVAQVLAQVVANVEHLIFSACDGDAAIVWTPTP